ncbi:Dna Transposase Thap9 [Manis pentadactyla]|nr:Dna Transposase Thap9 [Manis pentadactyla]
MTDQMECYPSVLQDIPQSPSTCTLAAFQDNCKDRRRKVLCVAGMSELRILLGCNGKISPLLGIEVHKEEEKIVLQ